MEYIAAYDFGTSGVKAVIVDYDGKLIASSERGYPLLCPAHGFAEQNPEDYWQAVCGATQEVVKTAGIPKENVMGLAFSTQGMGIIPVAADGSILSNNITWLDSRAGDQANRINKAIGEVYLNANDVVSKLLWIKENDPELYEKTTYFMDCTCFLNYKCTGEVYMELTRSSPHSLDAEELAHKHKLYAAAGVDLKKLPPLKTCTEFVGKLTSRAAEELGLTERAAVFMGTGDVPAAAAGAACSKLGDAHIYLGSSAWLTVLKDNIRVKNPCPGIYEMYSMNKEQMIYGGCVQSCCMTYEWAINQYYGAERKLLENGVLSKDESIYQFIEDEIREIPAGSNGLIVTPWLHGEHCPVLDEHARGTCINITNQHDRRHILNAVLEGVAYSLRGQVEYYRKDCGKDIASVTAVGGGALRDHWLQIIADVIQIPVHRTTNVRHAGAMGAAVVAAVGLGLYALEDAGKFINIEKSFYPRQENAVVYDKMYRIFMELYPALKDIYTDLNQSC